MLSKIHLIPTPRLLLLALLPLVFFALASWVPLLSLVGILLLATAVYLALTDRRQSVQPEQILIERHHNHKLTIRENNPVQLTIRNDSVQSLSLTIRDGIPPTFRLDQNKQAIQLDLAPYQKKVVAYQVKPTRRGEYGLGPVGIRWQSTWKLFTNQAVLSVETKSKVYPNLLQIKLYDRLLREGNSIYSGMRQYHFSGDGGEFEQLRDYVPDDDYRRISWKATAKYGRPITIDFAPERSQNVMIVVDTGRRMLSRPLGEARVTRLDLIINAVLMFGYVAISRADRVGLLTFDSEIHRYIPPRSGMGQFYKLVEAMHDVEASLAEPNYGHALRYLQANRQNRSLVVMLTDPTGQEAAQGLVEQLGAFYPRHLPVCVVLSDPAVLDAARRRPYSVDAIYQRAVAEQIMNERQLWLSRLNQRGVMTLDVPAHHMTAAIINHYLELKDHGRF